MFDILVYLACGWMAGVVLVLLCYLYGIDSLGRFSQMSNAVLMFAYAELSGSDMSAFASKRQDFINGVISGSLQGNVDTHGRRKQQQNQQNQRDRLHSTGIGVSPPRLTSVCQMSWYNDGEFTGAVHDCKLVLFDTHLMVYEVLASHGVGSHVRVITCERLVGRAPISRLVARRMFIGQSGWRGFSAPALNGHVLLISSRDVNEPLFGGRNKSFNEPHGMTFSPTGCSKQRNDSNHGNTNSNETEGGDVKVEGTVGGENCTAAMGDAATDWYPTSRGTLAVKFYYIRERERWLNLLDGPQEAAHWCEYLQNMTTPDTFNIFLSRLLFQSMRTTALADFLLSKLQKVLDRLSATKFPRGVEGRILLDDLILSSEVPAFSNVSAPQVAAKGEMTFDFDVLYRGGVSVRLRLNLLYRGIRIPHIVLSVKLLRCAGRLRVSVGPPPSKKFWVGCLTPPDLSVEVHQGLESGTGLLHRILTSLPDLSGIVTSLLRLHLMHNMMMPVMDDFPLPSVEKTPPASPKRQKKSWKEFDRHSAAAHGRRRTDVEKGVTSSPPQTPPLLSVTTTTTTTTTTPLPSVTVAAGGGMSGSVFEGGSFNTSACSGDAGNPDDDNHNTTDSAHPSIGLQLFQDQSGVHDTWRSGSVGHTLMTSMTAESVSRKSDAADPSNTRLNSEDVQRQRLKLKSRKLTRERVRCSAELPTTGDNNLESQPHL